MAEQGRDQRFRTGQLGRAAQRDQGFLGASRFEQHLAAQLEEIGILGILRDQAVGFRQRQIDARILVIGIGAGIARGHAGIAGGKAVQRAPRFFQIA